MATVAQLIDQILRRLDELAPSAPVRWTREELLVFINDALHELNLIAIQFEDTAALAVSPGANVYEVPSGTVAPLQMSHVGVLQRQSVDSLDNEVDWEAAVQTASRVRSWAPLGLNKVVIHPRPLAAATLGLERVVEHTPVADAADPFPVALEYEKALESFVVCRALFKEGGNELKNSLPMHKEFLDTVQELSGRQVIRHYPSLGIDKTEISPVTLRGAVRTIPKAGG